MLSKKGLLPWKK